ncbi:MAG: chemotaxis protein CheB [Hydrogenophaga sp.]|nr:chemotaxis protein CheB [Hydrogenophaga sp.]
MTTHKKPAASTSGDTVPGAARDAGGAAHPAFSSFPVVAIGASAGGLEAFEQFFRAMPADSGMGFVLVQHLDPTHTSILSEILQRSTAMPVVEAGQQMPIEPNRVYVIPPAHDMVVVRGALSLSVSSRQRGGQMPIDRFFRSLAEDQGEYAVGIVLSGTGTDGTLGLRAIHGAGGLCLVQDPATAKYEGMPASAIQAGFATQVLAVQDMPKALDADARLRRLILQNESVTTADKRLARVLVRLRAATGHDFSQYKKSTLGRRIARRMAQHGLVDIPAYEHYLAEHPGEVQALFHELLINVTSFFRDPDIFGYLKANVLPGLLAERAVGDPLRIWVAGCATGEEAYSLAMLLRELADEQHLDLPVQIYSTDIDAEAIAIGRAGLYPPNIAEDVSPERLRRFFLKEDKGYRVRKEIREMVIFALQSVIKDPPFTRLDVLSCRNLLIYLEPELQDRLMPIFHYALKPGGVLCLSPSESIGGHQDLFETVERKFNLYRAKSTLASRRALLSSRIAWTPDGIAPESGAASPRLLRETTVGDLARRALLQTFAPASVLTELNGDILYVHGETGKYLRLAPGQPSNNILDMAREGLQLELREAMHRAQTEGLPTLDREITVHSPDETQPVGLSVRVLSRSGQGHKLLLVSFRDIERPVARRGVRRSKSGLSAEALRIEELERELVLSKQGMGAMVEEQQASNEELQSTNEELQSTNEELQSTNEELETSKEELQSVNEELVTVNSELQSKVEQLTSMQDDMKNLLDNISVGAIFLDRELMIRRFTHGATSVYRLVATDLGRPLADIRSELRDVDLLADARTVLDTLAPIEREVQTGSTWYLARIQPYRTMDNVIDGVVLTFNDVTERVQAIAARRARDLAEAIVDTVREPLVVLDRQLHVVAVNRAYVSCFGGPASGLLGHSFYAVGGRLWDVAPMHDLLDTVPPAERIFEARELTHVIPGMGPQNLRLSARRVTEKGGSTELLLLSIEVLPDHPPQT